MNSELRVENLSLYALMQTLFGDYFDWTWYYKIMRYLNLHMRVYNACVLSCGESNNNFKKNFV